MLPAGRGRDIEARRWSAPRAYVLPPRDVIWRELLDLAKAKACVASGSEVPRSGLDGMGRPARREHHRRRKQRWRAPCRGRTIRTGPCSPSSRRARSSRWSSWLVAGIVPGLERYPLKKLEPDEDALLRLLQRWREEAA